MGTPRMVLPYLCAAVPGQHTKTHVSTQQKMGTPRAVLPYSRFIMFARISGGTLLSSSSMSTPDRLFHSSSGRNARQQQETARPPTVGGGSTNTGEAEREGHALQY